MNALDYVNGLGDQLAARASTFALTDHRIQDAAAFLAICRDEIGPEALGVASLAWDVHKVKEMFAAPEVGEVKLEDPDRVGQELIESSLDRNLELASGFLDTLAESSWAREQSDREGLLKEQQGALAAEKEMHEVQRANLEQQLNRSREKFDELHRDDSPEDRQRAEEKLNEAASAARAALEERQAADREIAERAREALEKDGPEI